MSRVAVCPWRPAVCWLPCPCAARVLATVGAASVRGVFGSVVAAFGIVGSECAGGGVTTGAVVAAGAAVGVVAAGAVVAGAVTGGSTGIGMVCGRSHGRITQSAAIAAPRLAMTTK